MTLFVNIFRSLVLFTIIFIRHCVVTFGEIRCHTAGTMLDFSGDVKSTLVTRTSFKKRPSVNLILSQEITAA